MMEYSKPTRPIQNILVLITVIGFALTGWLVGHILRHTIPLYQFQHPPVNEINPKIENGSQFDGIRREAVLTGDSSWGVFTSEGSLLLGQTLFNACVGNTYYTSLPAKCRSAEGELVKVGRVELGITLIPQDK